MSEILYKNVNGTNIQMTESEVADLTDHRERSRKQDELEEQEKLGRKAVIESMKARLGLSDEEIDIMMNGI